jgi:hypothetical protein
MATQHISSKKLIVVLHMICPNSGHGPVEHTMSQCKLAVENGADGVAIISSDATITKEQLVQAVNQIKKAHPCLIVIINFLVNASISMRNVPDFADGLWTDSGVDSRGVQSPVVSEAAVVRVSERFAWNGLWFAGFFHKGGHLTLPENEETLKELADHFLQLHTNVIPTTTGVGTGIAADVRTLARLHRAIGGRKPMAIASGVDAENIHQYLPFIEYFFVATGIEQRTSDPVTREFYASAGLPESAAVDVGYLDAVRVRALVDAIRSFVPHSSSFE